MSVVKLEIARSERSERARQMIEDVYKLADLEGLEGYFIVAFDKQAGHHVGFRLGDGVIGPTLLPSWLADVARRYSTMRAAIEDVEEERS